LTESHSDKDNGFTGIPLEESISWARSHGGGVPGSTISGSLGLPARMLLFHFTDVENIGPIIAAAIARRKPLFGTLSNRELEKPTINHS
jgi:hypothetical protein